jgi:hypothetical protein
MQKLLVIVEHFDFGCTKAIIVASKDTSGVASAVTVTRRRLVGVPEVGVRSCLSVAVGCNVEVVTSSKSGTITIVGIDSIVVVSVYGRFEWLQVVFVTE